ncbi:hypothetical protein ABPG72_000875 [Tetrahymena utriculariae]
MSNQINLLESWKEIYSTIDQDRIDKISLCPFISRIGITHSDQNIDKKYLAIFFAFIEKLFLNYQIEYIDYICKLMEQRKKETNCIIQIDTVLNFIYQLKTNFIKETVEMSYADFLYLKSQIFQLIENNQLFAAFIPFATAFIQFQSQQNNLQLEKYEKENVQKLSNILKMNIKVLLAKPDKITISANKYFPDNRTKMDKTIIVVENNKQSVHIAYDSSNERLHRFCYQGKLIYEQKNQQNTQNSQQAINDYQWIQQQNQLQNENQSLKQQIMLIQEEEAQIKLQNSQLKQQVQKYEEQELQLKQVFEQLRPLLQTMLDNQNKQIQQLKQFQPNNSRNIGLNDHLPQQFIQLNNAELQLKQQLQQLFFPTNSQKISSQIQQFQNPNSQQWLQQNNNCYELQQSQVLLQTSNNFKSQQIQDQVGQIKSQGLESSQPIYQVDPKQYNYFQNNQISQNINEAFTNSMQSNSNRQVSNQHFYPPPVQNQINQQQIINQNNNNNELQNQNLQNKYINNPADYPHTIQTFKRGNIQLNKNENTQTWTKCEQILSHRRKQKLLNCPICCQTKANEDLVFLKCAHSFCQECLKEHINSLISQGKRSFDFFTCLHCNLKLDPVELFSMLTDKQRSQIDEYYKDRNINFKCPNQKCGLQSKIQEKECLLKEFFVTSCCKSKVCSKCKQLYHPDIKCQSQIKEMIDQIAAYRDQQTTENAKLFRFCPVCFQFAFKDDGCDHVTCIKCKSDFCFSCSAPRPSILGHGNHYHRQGCHYFCEYKDQKGNKIDNELNLKKCVQCQKTKKPCQRPITWDKFLTEVQKEIGTEIFEAFPDNLIL